MSPVKCQGCEGCLDYRDPVAGPPALYAAPTPPFIAQGMNPMGMMVGMQELPARPPATPPSPQPSTMSGRMQGVHQRSGGPQATPQSPAQASPVRNPAQPPIQPGVGPMGSPFLSPLSAQQRNPARVRPWFTCPPSHDTLQW